MSVEQSLRLLLVDDDEDDFIIIRDLLTKARGDSLTIDWISDFSEALQVIENNPHELYDLYLFDYLLGAGTGLDLLEAVVASRSKAPVILLTGQGDHDVDLEAMRSGASDYLIKRELTAAQLDRSLRYALQKKKAEQQIFYMAMYDPLTSLPNRSMFVDRLGQVVARSKRHGGLCGVLFLDLNDFKRINDTLGHAAGDQLLAMAALRLSAQVRPSDSVSRAGASDSVTGRFGGDEFCILLSDLPDPGASVRVAQRIIKAFEQPFTLEGKELVIGVSIGIALGDGNSRDPEVLLRNSDMAMYAAKRKGRNGYQVYEQSMTSEAVANLALEEELRAAVAKGSFVLHYQPVVRLDTGLVSGMEALIRWTRGGEIVPPGVFIPLAEATDLIFPIGGWALRNACADARHFRDAGFPSLSIAVNLSARQCVPALVDQVKSALSAWQLDGSALTLEVTESVFLGDIDQVTTIFHKLKDLGVGLMIDDFGAGYFSFTMLKKLPVDGIKIDRSLVQGICDDLGSLAIVRAIQSMALALGLRTVAEGIETAEQLKLIVDTGCNLAQGYLFARPQNLSSTDALLIRERDTKTFSALLPSAPISP